eukprot:231517_1
MMTSLCCNSNRNLRNGNQFQFQEHVQMKSLHSIAPSTSTTLHQSTFSSWVKPNSKHDHHHHNKSCCRNIPIIHPFGPFRFIWDSLVIIALLYTSIEVPYSLSFGVKLSLSDTAGRIALFIDIFLLFDIVLNFRTGYIDKYDHLHIITSPVMIAKKYLSSWFWLDLISSLPFEFVIPLLIHEEDTRFSEFVKVLRIFRLLRGLKMLRVLRVFKLFKGFGGYVFVREAAMTLKCVRCLAAMLITAHYLACFWYLVGWQTAKNGKRSWIEIIEENHGDDATNFTKYSYSWYWAIVTLFTTGYGDIHAFNEEEQWTASVCILIGTCFFAYFIGVLTTLLEEGDRVRMYELERVEEAQLFCAHHRIPRQLARAIVTHIRYHCNYNYPFDHARIMASIPTYLQNHITNHLSQSLCELDMFAHLPASVVGQIALKMTSTSCNSGHTLFTKGELSHELFIQRTGRSILHRDGTKTRILERGDVCGEYAILSGKHRDTVKCITWSEFYVLDINDLLSILRDNFIDSKLFNREFRNIKTVLRKTLQKATKRKVQFGQSETLQNESGEFIHEFLTDATASMIRREDESQENEHKYEALRPPQHNSLTSVIESTSRKMHEQQRNKLRSTSSKRIMKKFSEMLTRENSAGRHELVIKKVNGLSMNTFDQDREFEYSDHEDSHFYSDTNHAHDIVHDAKPIANRTSIRTSTKAMRSKRSRAGKFGGKRRTNNNNNNYQKRTTFATMLRGITSNDEIQSEDTSDSMSMDQDDESETDMDPSPRLHTPHAITMKKTAGAPTTPLDVIPSNQAFQIEPGVALNVDQLGLKRIDSITDYRITPKDVEHVQSAASATATAAFVFDAIQNKKKNVHVIDVE